MTLFELLVVNNWMVIMDQVAAVDGEWSRIYFFSWWILSVLVMSNLLVAFILEEMAETQAASADLPARSSPTLGEAPTPSQETADERTMPMASVNS